jgi:hypothetical protein
VCWYPPTGWERGYSRTEPAWLGRDLDSAGFWIILARVSFLSFPFLLFSSLKAGFYTLGCDVDELMVPFRRPDFRTLARNRVGLAP